MSQTEITEFNQFESKLQEFKNRYDAVVYDLYDPEQEKQARSDRYAIGKVISALDKIHKELKAPLKEKVDLIDGERKRIKDQLLSIQDGIKTQIAEKERKEAEHMEMLQAKVDEIYACAEFDEFTQSDSEQLKARLAKAESFQIDDSYEHRKADATLAQVETIRKLNKLLEDRLKYETEQAELERLRKEEEERRRKEREDQIRKEAEERTKREAEEKAKKEREIAERKIREAEEAAKHAAEQERIRIERERQAEEAKAEAERQAEERKKAKQVHRQKIHSEAKQSFINAGFNDDDAQNIVTLIKDGKIANIVINY